MLLNGGGMIFYLKERDREKREKIKEISGERIDRCYQCGCCSAGCPTASEMEFLPNTVMMYLQEGDIEPVLNSRAIWICVGCYECASRCPQGIDIARIMEALRTIKLRQNYDRLRIEEKVKLEDYPTIALVATMRKFTA